MKFKVFLVIGAMVCIWFTVATAKGWRVPVSSGGSYGSGGSGYGNSYGRGYGGSWGIGK